MTYKIKSFFYFLCLATAAFIYNKIEQKNENLQSRLNSTSIAETDFEEVEDLKETQSDFLVNLE